MSNNDRCVGTWTCPHPQCVRLVGQVQRGREQQTNLAAHNRIVHPTVTVPTHGPGPHRV